jgi:hypothetical protein
VVALTDEAGVDHRVWAISAPATIATLRAALADVPVVLADGHHRFATALAVRDRRRAGDLGRGRGGPSAAGPPGSPAASAPWERTLMYLVDATDDGPQVLPVHRLVRTLRPGALALVGEDFEAVPAPGDVGLLEAAVRAERGLALGLRLAGGLGLVLRARAPHALRARLPDGHSDGWAALDAAVLDHAVLPRLCQPHVTGAVQYRSDAAAAAREVDAGAAAALFLVRPVDAATVCSLAAAGERMPVKTTWFRPKPRAGLVMRLVADPGEG